MPSVSITLSSEQVSRLQAQLVADGIDPDATADLVERVGLLERAELDWLTDWLQRSLDVKRRHNPPAGEEWAALVAEWDAFGRSRAPGRLEATLSSLLPVFEAYAAAADA